MRLADEQNPLIIKTMYDLTAFSLKDMTTCGAALRQMGDGAASMEEAAQNMVRYLYEHLVDADGQRATALVRFFITRPFHTLSSDLQQHVNGFLPQPLDDPALKCQTLLATIGDNPEWHSRHNSRFYKVHPLSKEIVDVNPMFGQVSQIFGIVLEQAVNRDPGPGARPGAGDIQHFARARCSRQRLRTRSGKFCHPIRDSFRVGDV